MYPPRRSERPPGESKQKEVRYLDIHEDDQLDEALVASWLGGPSPREMGEAMIYTRRHAHVSLLSASVIDNW